MHALAYILIVFALILILARLRIPLTLSITAGSVIIAFLFDLTVQESLRAFIDAILQPCTIALSIITALILTLSNVMQTAGVSQQIVSLAKTVLRRPGLTMAALPALIGLLPMPGGALFSAPMVESASPNKKIPPSTLSAINYWFRHVWEHFWPLYPGVMLAVTLTSTQYGRFILFQAPLGIFMAGAGILIFRNIHPDTHVKSSPPPPQTKRKLILATSPIWIIILVWIPAKYLILATLYPYLSQELQSTTQRYLPLILGLIVSITITAITKQLPTKDVAKALVKKSTYNMVSLIVSVMIFQYILQTADAATQVAREMLSLHIPVTLVVAVLPFIAGFVTGIAVAFVGISFPIVIALVAALPQEPSMQPYIALAYGFGHLGQMLSPLHICHIVSNQYFNTSFAPVYKKIIPSAILLALLITAYFTIIQLYLN